MQKPYLKFYKKIGPHSVYIVDGDYVRSHIDIDFTNFGYHAEQDYIPENEWWFDKDYETVEYRFYIDNLLVREKYIQGGATTTEARVAGDKFEKRERAKANPKLYTHVDFTNVKKHKVGTIGTVTVYIVAGDQVRVIDEDYAEGGHDIVYKYIRPPHTIWLDDSLKPTAYRWLLIHEFYERSIMAFGMKYEDAHYRASIVELYCRLYPKMTNPILDYLQRHEKDKNVLLRLPKLLRFGKNN